MARLFAISTITTSSNARAATDPVAQKQLDYLKQLDQNLEPVRQHVIDLAVANGVDLKDALAMTDEQMIQFIASSKNLGPTMT